MALTKLTTDLIDGDLGGGTTWVSDPKTANFTAVAGEGYLVDTSSAAVTVTLPGSPSVGDEIIIVDYAGNAGTNNITLGRNSLNIRGAASDLVLDNNNQTARLLYSGATKGWLVTTEAGAGASAAALLPSPFSVDYLVVAGGGSGGSSGGRGGGGGAGGYRTSYGDASVSDLSLETFTNYIVSVGAGGSAVTTNETNGNNGTNSTFATITSTGGGGGGGYNRAGLSGGSGGGGSWDTSAAGGSGNAGGYTPAEGNAGGSGGAGGYGAGGGGGASGVGAEGIDSNGGAGGNGLSATILSVANATTASVGEVSGSYVYFAGGGGGGATGTGGAGGLGGGSNGSGVPSSNATPNTGGGSGGAGASGTGSGGSGVIILRYPGDYTIAETSSPTVLTFNTYIEGTDKVTVFTSGENGTIQFS